MTITIRKAQRRQAKLRLALAGTSGSGKTYSALEIAFGLGGKIVVLDTEHSSADLYDNLGDYDIVDLAPPFRAEDYIEAIHTVERAGYEVIIIDSLSHAWSGEGGLLDQQGKIAESSPSKNSYMAWNKITPLHYKLIEAMLQSPAHVIATMRSKTAYVIDNSEGKNKPVKIGTAPVQRDGMEYEFTAWFDLNTNHTVNVSKDRTQMFTEEYFVPSRATGERLRAWLNSGAAPLPQPPRAATTPATPPTATVRSPPKVLPNGTPSTAAATPAEDPAQHKGHLNDERYCFDCGAKIDPSREGAVSKRDHNRYLCLECLKKANRQAEANAKPASKQAPKPPSAAPKAVAEQAPEEKRDQPSTTSLKEKIAEIQAREDARDTGYTCATCGKDVSPNERDSSMMSLRKVLCRDCLDAEFENMKRPEEMA